MRLPAGVADPIFTHELALELKMSVAQLGQAMSAHELTVEWPAYFEVKRRMAEQEAEAGAEREKAQPKPVAG